MEAAVPLHTSGHDAPRSRAPMRTRILMLTVGWLIVLMPFLFWRGTWFGRPLSDQQITEYLHDAAKPRHTQHALVQIGERMARSDGKVANWYPDLVALASSRVEEIRNTDAWVMGQDNTRPEFHQALLAMLQDRSPVVRGNAALALVRFGDAAGHDQIVSLLQPSNLTAPAAGKITATTKAGAAVRQQGIIARLQSDEREVEVRTPITGRVRSIAVRQGQTVATGTELATVDPGSDQVWEALRALYLVGRPEDLPLIQPYTLASADFPDRVRQQAIETQKAIHARSGS